MLACLSASVGCRTVRVVVTDCPAPSPEEAADLSDWLLETPERPAQDWAARVVGVLYPEDLREVRGEE